MRLTITAILLLSCVNTVAAEVLTSTTQPHSDTKVQPLLEDEIKVNKVLDSLHQFASDANFDSYFSLYSDNAIFIGTDASEVWTMSAFKAYAQLTFRKDVDGHIPPIQDIYIFQITAMWRGSMNF